MDRETPTLGYADAYSSFLLCAERIAMCFGVSAKDPLVEARRRRLFAGREDLMLDIALTLNWTVESEQVDGAVQGPGASQPVAVADDGSGLTAAGRATARFPHHEEE